MEGDGTDRWRRVACALVGALALGACERVGQTLDDMRPAAQDAPAPTTLPEPMPEALPPPVAPWERFPEPEILFSLEQWDAASSDTRAEAGRLVAERLPGFTYTGLATFSSGGAAHEVALYSHERTGLDFVLVPVGTFRMGSPASEDGRSFDEVRRTVRLTRPFLICRTEVTQRAWSNVRSKNPSHFEDPFKPVETVTIIDIERFLYRAKLELPTEAQWEYACRAGTQEAYSFGDGERGDLGDHAWYEENSAGTTHPVATKKPNAFGLHDMHGNVMEWCGDGYDVPEEGDVEDPVGKESSSDKVVKGGGYQNGAAVQRCAFRLRTHPGDKQPGIGFRPVKTLPAPR